MGSRGRRRRTRSRRSRGKRAGAGTCRGAGGGRRSWLRLRGLRSGIGRGRGSDWGGWLLKVREDPVLSVSPRSMRLKCGKPNREVTFDLNRSHDIDMDEGISRNDCRKSFKTKCPEYKSFSNKLGPCVSRGTFLMRIFIAERTSELRLP